MVVEEFAREKCLLLIEGVELEERHLLNKADREYLLQYADEKECLGGGVYKYHFTRMNL